MGWVWAASGEWRRQTHCGCTEWVRDWRERGKRAGDKAREAVFSPGFKCVSIETSWSSCSICPGSACYTFQLRRWHMYCGQSSGETHLAGTWATLSSPNAPGTSKHHLSTEELSTAVLPCHSSSMLAHQELASTAVQFWCNGTTEHPPRLFVCLFVYCLLPGSGSTETR